MGSNSNNNKKLKEGFCCFLRGKVFKVEPVTFCRVIKSCMPLDIKIKGSPSKHLLVLTCLQNVFETSSASQFYVFQDALKTSCKDALKTSWRRYQDAWKTKKCYAEDVLKTLWRHVLEMFWRYYWEKHNTGDICI